MVNVLPTPLEGVWIVEPDIFRDGRGFFLESYHQRKYAEAGIPAVFVQDNHSQSVRGTLRGLHAQLIHPQAKLVRALNGEIFDVVVDIRRGSPTYKRWFGVTLSSDNFRQCYIPIGYAHGFCVTSDWAEVEYKCTDFYDPVGELHLLWKDPELAIEWPIRDPILSPKDRAALRLCDVESGLPVYRPQTIES